MNKSACWHLEKPCQPCLVKQFIFVMFTQELPLEPGVQDGYILQLVLLSIFLAVTLVLLSVLLIACRRCCEGDQSYARWDKSLLYQQMQTCDWQVNSRIIYLFTTAEETLQPVMNLCFSKKKVTNDCGLLFQEVWLWSSDWLTESIFDRVVDWLSRWLKNSLAHWLINQAPYWLTDEWLIEWINERVSSWLNAHGQNLQYNSCMLGATWT